MSTETQASDSKTSRVNPMIDKEENGHHIIFVGEIKEEWEENLVLAADIMAKAGRSPPDGSILEALDRKGGSAVMEFQPQDKVDLTVKDRKFFRITPGGGGFS